ncbi:sensor protein ZraS [Klebsiella pneumoniae]|nr:sensor protein ZraS [Klebsiella pneumoniae]
MKIKSLSRDAAAGALSWLLTGTVVLLVMLFSAMIVRDYGRETTAARQTIEEKGSVLIRALESGTRVGMGMRMHHAQLQALLEEMAWQPGVLWFAVTDENGKIIAHSDPQQVDKTLYSPAQMRALAVGEQARWRRLSEPQPALEIYRHFRPLNPARGHHMGMMNRGNSALAQAIVPQVIFIAFDSRELDAAQARGQRNMAIMLGAAALVIAATILAQFWFRRYRRSRKQLLEAMARKEKLVALGHLAAGVAHEIRNPLSSIKGLAKYFAERTSPGGESHQLAQVMARKEKLVALGHLAAGVAHEIRNPLSSIKGLAKYFAERTSPGGESHQLAQVMAKEADRLNRVVSELLELVRPAHLNYQTVDINALIRHSLQLVSQDAQSRGIALQFTPRPELTTISADPDRLNQVLLNLYLNAMQAIGRDGIIRVSASEADRQRVKIVVTDSGKGMSDEELQAIFTPYFTTKADGTGLGLAVVQNIIEQHGGTIRAESQPGAGAIFTLWLPVDAQRREDEQR